MNCIKMYFMSETILLKGDRFSVRFVSTARKKKSQKPFLVGFVSALTGELIYLHFFNAHFTLAHYTH